MLGRRSARLHALRGPGIGIKAAIVVAFTVLGHVQSIGSTPVGGCGLPGEVFCENFEGGISSLASRSGDLDSAKITGGRQRGTGDRGPNYIQPADIPECRAGSMRNPLPPHDALICDPVAARNSHHALIAAASQNYGDALFRVDQPFDFAARTGTIRTDMSLDGANGNGAPEIVLSDRPPAVASISDENGKGTALSNGFIIHFRINCSSHSIAPLVRLYKDYREIPLADEQTGCCSCAHQNAVRTSPGKLNRVELRISQSKLEIWATDYSQDGVVFGPLRRVFNSERLDLSFARGWYSFGVHNHATMKYEGRASHNSYFDNIAFDGPAVDAPRVYQVPDNALHEGSGQNLGYPFYNRNQPTMKPLHFQNVDIGGISHAKLVFNVFIDGYNSFVGRKTYYRLNKGPWRQYSVPEGVSNNVAQFAHRTMFALDVDITELVNGRNSVEFSSDDLWMGVAAYVSNVDLMVWKQ